MPFLGIFRLSIAAARPSKNAAKQLLEILDHFCSPSIHPWKINVSSAKSHNSTQLEMVLLGATSQILVKIVIKRLK